MRSLETRKDLVVRKGGVNGRLHSEGCLGSRSVTLAGARILKSSPEHAASLIMEKGGPCPLLDTSEYNPTTSFIRQQGNGEMGGWHSCRKRAIGLALDCHVQQSVQ